MILLIDNYDSFSYNLYQLIGSVNPDIQVVRNDEISLGEIEKLAPEAIVLSPRTWKTGGGRHLYSGDQRVRWKKSQFWVCVWDIRVSAKPLAEWFPMQRN